MYRLEKPDRADNVVKVVKRLSDNTFIPFDPANSDYQQYLKWLEEGNQPLPAENE